MNRIVSILMICLAGCGTETTEPSATELEEPKEANEIEKARDEAKQVEMLDKQILEAKKDYEFYRNTQKIKHGFDMVNASDNAKPAVRKAYDSVTMAWEDREREIEKMDNRAEKLAAYKVLATTMRKEGPALTKKCDAIIEAGR